MDIFCADLTADEIPGVITGAIFVIRSDDFITGLELQRPRNNIYSMRCIGNIDQIVGIGI